MNTTRNTATDTERDICIPVSWTEVSRHDPETQSRPYMNTVRFYPSSPGRATLQIRSESGLRGAGKTKIWHWIVSAGLDLRTAVRLYDALGVWVSEWSAEQVKAVRQEISQEV